MVITVGFDPTNPSSNPGTTFFFLINLFMRFCLNDAHFHTNFLFFFCFSCFLFTVSFWDSLGFLYDRNFHVSEFCEALSGRDDDIVFKFLTNEKVDNHSSAIFLKSRLAQGYENQFLV